MGLIISVHPCEEPCRERRPAGGSAWAGLESDATFGNRTGLKTGHCKGKGARSRQDWDSSSVPLPDKHSTRGNNLWTGAG